jgi:hypothetical protein
MKPHKHAELIKAWADGHTIQTQSKIDGSWWDQDDPEWDEGYEYRIKPAEKQPDVRWLWANINGSISTTFASIEQVNAQSHPEHWIRLEWSRTEFPQ